MKKGPNGTILNPHTNRYVKKDGKVGQKFLAEAGEKPAAST